MAIQKLVQANIYQECSEQFPGNATLILECVSNAFQEQEENRGKDLQSFLLVITGAMIFFMQAGFAMLCAGSVRIKNVQNTMLKNLLDACGAALAFFLVGYAFAFGGENDKTGTSFIGTSDFLTTGDSSALWFFQYTFSATSVTIVAGTLAERCQMAAYLCYSVVVAGLIYPVVAHAIWSNNGFLSNSNIDPFLGSGVVDFAGSGVVHMTGGAIALCATMILGPRRGRFYDSQGEPLETPKPFPGHSVALQLLGTMMLWFGWYGFNAGSALTLGNENVGKVAANAAVSTALSGAAGGVSALFTNLYFEEKRTGEPNFSLHFAMNGSLGGLVAITSGCAVVEPWAAILTGTIAGWMYMLGSQLLIKLRIDDAVDAIPVHMINGMWGLIMTGFVASPRKLELTYGNSDHPGWFYSLGRGDTTAKLLGCQVCAVLFILGWTFFTMFPFYIWLNYKGWLRSDSLEELVGLDISYHGGMNELGGSVKTEYVEAYNRQRKNLRNRRSGNPNFDRWAPASTTIPDSWNGGDCQPDLSGSRGPDDMSKDPSCMSKDPSLDPEMCQEAAASEASLAQESYTSPLTMRS